MNKITCPSSMTVNDELLDKLDEVKRLYDSALMTTSNATKQDLHSKILSKLSSLTNQHHHGYFLNDSNSKVNLNHFFYESNSLSYYSVCFAEKILIEILVHVGDCLDGRDSKQFTNLMIYTSVVKNLAEKSVISIVQDLFIFC
jgi:hypothetical protein